MQVLFGILVVVAIGAWCLAIWSAMTVWRMSPAGDRFGNYFRLGCWRFGVLEERLGPSVRPVLNRYRLGFILFLASILVALATGLMNADDLVQ
jgi:hypothetical protein